MWSWLSKAFSEGESPSSSRVMMLISTLFSCGWVTHIVVHSHALPDATTLVGLVTFSTAPYTVGKLTQKS